MEAVTIPQVVDRIRSAHPVREVRILQAQVAAIIPWAVEGLLPAMDHHMLVTIAQLEHLAPAIAITRHPLANSMAPTAMVSVTGLAAVILELLSRAPL